MTHDLKGVSGVRTLCILLQEIPSPSDIDIPSELQPEGSKGMRRLFVYDD